MKNYRLGKLLSDTGQMVKENYLAWVSVTAVFAMVYWLLLRLPVLLDLTTLREENFFEVLTAVLLTQLLTHAFLKKYYLILVRQPDVVRNYFLQALKHTFTDGFVKRVKYYLLYLLTHALIFILLAGLFAMGIYQLKGESLFNELSLSSFLTHVGQAPLWMKLVFFAGLYLAQMYFFMVPYIIQDTLSSDNILIPLTFRACLKNSVRLMKGQKWNYFALTGLAFLIEFIYLNIVMKIVQTLLWSPLSFLATGFLLLITFIKFITADTYLAAANAILADALLTEEWQISFFGGENE